jgi:hypothetical protein
MDDIPIPCLMFDGSDMRAREHQFVPLVSTIAETVDGFVDVMLMPCIYRGPNQIV